MTYNHLIQVQDINSIYLLRGLSPLSKETCKLTKVKWITKILIKMSMTQLSLAHLNREQVEENNISLLKSSNQTWSTSLNNNKFNKIIREHLEVLELSEQGQIHMRTPIRILIALTQEQIEYWQLNSTKIMQFQDHTPSS